jgi:hypothetical protein
MGDTPVLATEIPEGWVTAKPLITQIFGHARCPAGVCVLAGVLLDDGTNIYTLTWPTGQRVARVCDDTGWAIEERFAGDQPATDDDARAVMWRDAIEALAEANAAARRLGF